MANSNFVVQNGLSVGGLTIFAGNGDIISSGNLTTTGSGSISSANGFGGLNPASIYSGSSNVSVTATNVFANISGTPQVTIASTGVTIAGNLTVQGTTTTVNNEIVNNTETLTQNLIVSGITYAGGNLVANSGTASSSTTTGAIVVAGTGGVGVGGAVNVGSTITASGNIAVNTATDAAITTTTAVAEIFNSGATTLKVGGAATAISIGAATGTTTVNNGLTVTGTFTGGAPAGSLTGSTLASGVTASSLTSVGTLTSLSSGAITTTGTLAVNASGGITTNQTSFPLVNATATTINFGGAATTINIGAANGALNINGNVVPQANVVYNLGSGSAWFNKFYGVSTQAQYADLAENYQADKFYNPGTVLMFGGAEEVTVADADTTAVAGVVSTNPAHLMNGALTGPTVVALALSGRVPCNVIGPVKKGDMMVSAGFGFAKVNNNPAIGTVIGKALQDFPITSKGVIEVVVGRV